MLTNNINHRSKDQTRGNINDQRIITQVAQQKIMPTLRKIIEY